MPKTVTMKKSEYDKMAAAVLRAKYLKKTPKGYSKSEIKSMSDNSILDMGYFLHEGEFDEFESCDGKEPDVVYRIIDDSPPDDFDDGTPW